MSGFGGGGGFGFGSQAADPFGSQANTGFGSGGGFGGAGSSAPPSFGFGSSQPQQQQPNTGFGVAPNASFGNAAPFGQASFGSSTPPSATTFGASPNLVAPAPFGQATTNSFGSAGSSNQGGFNSGFENQSSGFPSGNATTSGFGTFGNPPNSNLNDSAMSNPFGSTAINNTSPATVTFGTSSNVVTNNKQGGFSSTPNSSWGAPDPSAGFGSNPFATSQNRNNPNEMGMQHQSDSEDMADGSTSPFGHSRNSAPPQHNIRSTNLSPINEQNPMADSSTANSFSAGKNNDERTIRANLEEKKRLQAEIEAKKKKLLERKQRKKPAKEGSLSADASPFVPKAASEAAAQASLAERNAVRFNQQPDKAAQASLAERNAMRFNQQQDTSRTRELLPSDIKESVQDSESKTSSGVTEKGREDLKNATSLVGTCQYMCPDDELLRRERENDIQQLEIPLPGNLHPANWALRDTVVKRFRRSAADYKLDVPEWVRPPDVLERVCSYLEEWVMVRTAWSP